MVSQDLRAFPPAAPLRPFGESRMLPPAAYTSAEVFAWERKHFFGGGWTCAGHASLLPSAGDQLAVETGAGGAVLGHSPAVNARAIVCPYHSWAYSLSGELCGAPGYRGLSSREWSLRELPAVEWHGLVFVDGSGGAAG